MLVCDVRMLFADRSLRCTRQRVEVYQALAAMRSHPTAEQLHRTLAGTSPGISLATVYNTLEVLCDAGLTRKVPVCEGAARYDADVSRHLHAVTREGHVVDLPLDLSAQILAALPPALQERVEGAVGAPVVQLSIDFVPGEARPPRPQPA